MAKKWLVNVIYTFFQWHGQKVVSKRYLYFPVQIMNQNDIAGTYVNNPKVGETTRKIMP